MLFKKSSPRTTTFTGGFKSTNIRSPNLSYKGIPKEYPNGDKIPRSERLRVAKEIMKIRSEDATYDVYDGEGNYMKSFDNENDAKRYSMQYMNSTVMKRMKDSSIKTQMQEYDKQKQEREYNEMREAEGRTVLNSSLAL